jgi:glucose-6-phosphate 1-dehydrogenase
VYEASRRPDKAGKAHARGNVIFYLTPVADGLFGTWWMSRQGKATGRTRTRTERQFRPRRDREAIWSQSDIGARLNAAILRTLNESQIFRIDHFLGKDTVQSIMALRFANGLFEPIWNRDRIDHVQITAAETVGVEKRGKFYEVTGALRDMVPNHVLSLLTMVAMEPPTGFDAAAIRSKKAEVLAAMPAVKSDQAVRG